MILAMRFNKAIDKVSVLSFDLDDTLYNNHPIIKAAVQAQIDYLSQIQPWVEQGPEYWSYCRNEVIKQHPNLTNDVTEWRKAALQFGMTKLTLTRTQANQYALEAYQAFSDARSDITVSQEVLDLLAALRQRFKLIAITNGNVEVDKFNLRNAFELVLKAGPDGKAKPEPDLFHNAAAQLNVNLSEILHIGDSLDTDVRGANAAGCQSVWLNNQPLKYRYQGLAHLEIENINDLYQLVKI